MTGREELQKKVEGLKKEVEQKKAAEEKSLAAVKKEMDLKREEMQKKFGTDVNVGTNDIDETDKSMPEVRLVQGSGALEFANADDERMVGRFWQSDTKNQLKNPIVNIVCVKKGFGENFKRTETVKKQIFFMVFQYDVDVYRMYINGWSLEGARDFHTKVGGVKAKYGIPMYALKVRLESKNKEGEAKDENGNPVHYNVKAAVFAIVEDDQEFPIIEDDPNRLNYLKEMAIRFEKSGGRFLQTEFPVAEANDPYGRRPGSQPAQELRPIGEDQPKALRSPAATVAEAARVQSDPPPPDPGEVTEEIKPDDIPF